MQGAVGSETDYGDPFEAALRWQRDGAPSGCTSSTSTPPSAAATTASYLPASRDGWTLPSNCPAGFRYDGSLAAALATGAARVNLGTAALESPDWVRSAIARHGEQISVGLDVRGTTLAARGWAWEGGDIWETMARLDADGCARYVVTDITKDGTLAGPNLQLLSDVCTRTDAAVIASGGVSSLDDLRAIAGLGLEDGRRVEGAIVGKALYARAFTLPEALAAVR